MRTFRQGPLRGEISVPGDKSISHRALLLGALSPQPLKISNLNPGRDVFATAQALQAIGAGSGALRDPSGVIDCLNSGSTARMMMGVITGANLSATFDGDESLRKRPMEPVAAHLRAFGAKIETADGKMPVRVRGTAAPESRRIILVSPSAQIKTSLLLAAAYSGTPIEILGDKGSRDHTERLLQYFGADIAYDRSKVTLRSMPSAFKDVVVAGDFSAAAFFIVAASVSPGSELVIRDCGVNPSRTGLLDALRMMGADIAIENERTVSGEPVGDIRVKPAALRGADISADVALRAIDEIVVLAVAAAFANGRTRITGVRELRTKESDRIAAIERLLAAAGIAVEILPNGIAIDGGAPRANGATVDTHGDHRTAMAAAALAAGAGTLAIDDEACIAVSFPAFIEQMERVQA
ncbi:MAG TPA: 3-phosphoshikimate 1-carboxyvinyltransferase [Candidatus Baltobacteraceae bacterium]|nr:3-phosphoshikimate 1-carboxyvinyltransferase [Candidatus Baltobacteraceae bacterium]